jgi:hypothetical protein
MDKRRLVGLLVLVLVSIPGLGLTIGGGMWMFSRVKLWKGGVETTGHIIKVAEHVSTDYDRNHSRSTSTSYYPVVEFTAQDGSSVQFEGSTGSGSPEWSIGEEIDVLYPADKPRKAAINTFEQFWLGPVGVSVFGLMLLVGGVAAFYFTRGP